MNDWILLSLLVCVFGFLKELRPSEPFIYEFLIGKWRNITEEQVNQQVYPAGTYAYLGLLIVVFLITDLSRYKPLIVFMGIFGVIVWSMLLWTTELWELLVLEVFYGAFMACEVAYYTYIYAKVDKEYYQQVTSHTRAAVLIGRALSGILGQVLVTFDIMDYRQLHYISFGALIVATLWSLLLPPVKKSIYFHQEATRQLSMNQKIHGAFGSMWDHFKHAYSNKYTVRWSIWWSLATGGYIQVQIYMQPLWTAIVNDPDWPIYNGAVEAALTVIGFLGALTAGVLKVDWRRNGEFALMACSLAQGVVIVISSQTDYVVVSYVNYIIFGALYHFVITIASSEIAKHIDEDSYGLIFGINTFLALLFQTILTLVVVTSRVGFALHPRNQFLVYGILHIVLGLVYLFIASISFIKNRKRFTGSNISIVTG